MPSPLKTGMGMTGDDVASAFDIIEENGGVGEFEADDYIETERYNFPRFPGAEQIGTCGRRGALHTGIHTCPMYDEPEKSGFVVDQGNMYLSRSGSGPYDTDVETVAAWLAAPRNVVGAVLLLGEPGTGKTALIEAAVTFAGRTLTTLLCTPDHTKNDLLKMFVGEGNGEPVNGRPTPFALGPLAYAAKHGHTFYGDEFMLLVDGLKPLFYSLADGRHFLPEGNVDGSPLEIHPDFRLILSSNPLVRGASLPEPLASRCASTTLTVETDARLLRDLGIADEVVAAWEALGTSNLWRPQVRELRLADYWMGIDMAQAVSAMVPEHCPESQRRAVRDTVVSYMGGNVRGDGRLVVS